MVLDVHRAAQYHQPAVTVHVELRIRVPLEVLEADPVPAPPDQRIQRAQGLGGDMLEDEEARHRRIMPKARLAPPMAAGNALIAGRAA